MQRQIQDPHQKALAINLDESRYGTIAEIGAGQETARWFFRVGGAAGTIAKAMSAYDMTVSDAIYGPSPRYVSRDRLQAMLRVESGGVWQRLVGGRGGHCAFFAIANTVAARSFTRKVDGSGWLGIMFQHAPGAEPSQIDIHVNLHGRNNLQDQETLGVLGVNLIYGALMLGGDPEELLLSLMDHLYPELLEVDMIEFLGPAFPTVDNRLMALRLVQRGFSEAAMFTPDGKVIQVADHLYKKSVLVERSRFRPPTKLNFNLLDQAQSAFLADSAVGPDELVVLSEMTVARLGNPDEDEVTDFLHRADILCALGKTVLISHFGEYYRLAQYLFQLTPRPIAIAMGLPALERIFDESYYEDLPGGILESFGRLFKQDLRLYVCPRLDVDSGQKTQAEEFELSGNLRHLYRYLLEGGYVRPLNTVEPGYLDIHSHRVLEMIRRGEPDWEEMVPDELVGMIKQNHYFEFGVDRR